MKKEIPPRFICLISLFLCIVSLAALFIIGRELRNNSDIAARLEQALFSMVPQAPKAQDIYVKSLFDYSGDPFLGPAEAETVLIVFTDYECPYCADLYNKGLGPLMDYYGPGRGPKIVFKNFPLTDIHEHAYFASLLSEWAAENGKFGSFCRAVSEDFSAFINDGLWEAWAEREGLDPKDFSSRRTQERLKKQVDRDIKEGLDAGIQATPSMVLGGKIIPGALSLQKLAVLISENQLKTPMVLKTGEAAKNSSLYAFIDIRSPEEYAASHIAGAVNIPWASDSFLSDLSALTEMRPLVLYCNRGITSLEACQAVRSMGMSSVFSLGDGFFYWTALKLPVKP